VRYKKSVLLITIVMAVSLSSVELQPEHERHTATAGSETIGQPSKAFGPRLLSFEANRGQAGADVRFLARAGRFAVLLTSTETFLVLRSSRPTSDQGDGLTAPDASAQSRPENTGAVLRMTLIGASRSPSLSGVNPLPGKSHYFIGNDPAQWHTNIPNYAKVMYRGVYPGVDLMYYGNGQQLEYDFVLAPGTDPNRIVLGFEGVERLRINDTGGLVLETAAGEIVQHAPTVYQEIDGGRQPVSGRYVFRTPESKLARESPSPKRQYVGFEVGEYDATRPLVIDPTLTYSTYLGGAGFDGAHSITVDADGNAYLTGETDSIDFPTTAGAFQTVNGGLHDVWVAKLNPAGTAILYSTYLGGDSNDRGNSITVDSAGNAYVTGRVGSLNFPTTPGAFRRFFGGDVFDGFVTKLSSDGSALLYSTFLGGSGNDSVFSIALDSSGNAFVTGGTASGDFPVTAAAFQSTYGGGIPGNDSFVTKLNSAGSTLLYSSYLGGSFTDRSNGIVVDAAGNAYLTGWTDSPDFPAANAFQPAKAGGRDAFVTKVNPDGSGLVYSTFLGGIGEDAGLSIAMDSSEFPYLTGYTESTDFPTRNPLQPANGGGRDAFVAKFTTSGSALVYSTYLGGADGENVALTGILVGGIAVDSSGSAHVTGATRSGDFPTQNPLQATYGGGLDDAFVARVNPAGTGLIHSTYLGGSLSDVGVGIAVRPSGEAYVAGQTSSTDFPTVGAVQPTPGGFSDAFVALITEAAGPAADLSVMMAVAPNPVMPGSPITYTIELANNGPQGATSLTLSDSLPPDTTFQSLAAPGAWSCTTPAVGGRGAVSCTASSMANGASVTFTLGVRLDDGVADGTVISNTASASAATPDPVPGNNSSTATTTVSNPAGSADLAVTMTVTPDPVMPGSPITYTIGLANNGPQAAMSPMLSDELPPATTFQSLVAPAAWSCTTPEVGGPGTVTCTTSSMANGASDSFALEVRLDDGVADGTVISNTASASAATSDPVPGNNSSTATTTVSNPAGSADLAVMMTVAPDPVMPGSPITYTIGLANNGPQGAMSPMLSDELPPETTFQSLAAPAAWSCTTPEVGGRGTVTCTTSSMANGASDSFALEVRLDDGVGDGAVISSTVSASAATSDPVPDNNSSTATTTVSNTAGSADLAVTMTVAPDPVTPGSLMVYTIDLVNNGPQDGMSPMLSDELPPETTFQSLAAPADWSCTTPEIGALGAVTCTAASVTTGASHTFTLEVLVVDAVGDGTVIGNTATISADTADPVPDNGTATATSTVVALNSWKSLRETLSEAWPGEADRPRVPVGGLHLREQAVRSGPTPFLRWPLQNSSRPPPELQPF